MGIRDPRSEDHAGVKTIAHLIDRARAAQRAIDGWSQAQVDDLVTAAAWAIVEPERNRTLAECAVRDTGLGKVAKIAELRQRKGRGWRGGPRRVARFQTIVNRDLRRMSMG